MRNHSFGATVSHRPDPEKPVIFGLDSQTQAEKLADNRNDWMAYALLLEDLARQGYDLSAYAAASQLSNTVDFLHAPDGMLHLCQNFQDAYKELTGLDPHRTIDGAKLLVKP